MWRDVIKVVVGREVAGFVARVLYALLGALVAAQAPAEPLGEPPPEIEWSDS